MLRFCIWHPQSFKVPPDQELADFHQVLVEIQKSCEIHDQKGVAVRDW